MSETVSNYTTYVYIPTTVINTIVRVFLLIIERFRLCVLLSVEEKSSRICTLQVVTTELLASQTAYFVFITRVY